LRKNLKAEKDKRIENIRNKISRKEDKGEKK
jgi:hypothetical protein